MAQVFYDHLIDWERLDRELLFLELSSDERLELLELAEESIHSGILLLICEQLSRDKHEEFIERFHSAPHELRHIIYLREHGLDDIERSIRLRSLEVIEEMVETIRRHDRKKNSAGK